MADQRWSALRRVGEAAGWLIDPGEVCLASCISAIMLIDSADAQHCCSFCNCSVESDCLHNAHTNSAPCIHCAFFCK